MVVCAHSASHTKHSFFGCRYKRLVVRSGAKNAIAANAHSMMRVIWYMLTNGEELRDLGEDYYISRYKDRQIRACVNKPQKFGVGTSVLLCETADA